MKDPFEYYHAFKNHHWTSGGCHGMRIEKTNDISSKVRIAIQFYPLLLRFSSQKRGWKHKCASHGKSILNVSLYNTMPLQQHKRWKSIFDLFWMCRFIIHSNQHKSNTNPFWMCRFIIQRCPNQHKRCRSKGRIPLPKRMNFRKSSKGGGEGHFQSKNLSCRFLPL